MKEVVVTTRIAAPPEAVFAAIADPRKPFLTGNPVTTMTVVGDQTVGAGTVYRWTFALPLGLTLQFDEVVTEWIENQCLAYRAISGWEMAAASALAPDDGGTRVTFTLRYQLPGLWQWLIPRRLARLGARQALANLRNYVPRQTVGAGRGHGKPVTLFEQTIAIAAPPEEVFRVVGDPRSKLAWVPAIKRVEMHAGHTPGLGARYVASSRVARAEFAFQEEIVEWEPPHRLVYQGESPWGRFCTTWRIEPAPGGSWAHYRMEYWFPGGRPGRLVGSLLATFVRGPMTRGVARRVKATVEGGKKEAD
ncbi:MAG: SRPBCC family protein [Ardenticatenaceae bacterium]|nr:SRPBCC family protein [Ardenticatenaceae bacterium]